LEPHFLSHSLFDSLLNIVLKYRDRIDTSLIQPRVNWRRTHNQICRTHGVPFNSAEAQFENLGVSDQKTKRALRFETQNKKNQVVCSKS
jgi:hypothetical protein